jgi:hypothetical protein
MNKILVIILAIAASSYGVTICGQYDDYQCGNYSHETCIWSPTGGWEQCVTTPCDTNNSWSLTYTFEGGPSNWQVQTYPNVCFQDGINSRTLPIGWPFKVRDLKPTYASLTVDQMPTQGRWNCSFDIWTAKTAYAGDRDRQLELMILINYSSDLSPTVNDPSATIEGHTWRIKTMNMSTWKYISFLATPRFNSFEGMNLTEFMKYAMDHGQANPDHYVSLFQHGFEIFWGSGTASVAKYKIWQTGTSVNPGYASLASLSNPGSKTRAYTIVNGVLSTPQRTSLSTGGCRYLYDITGRNLPLRPFVNMQDGIYLAVPPER